MAHVAKMQVVVLADALTRRAPSDPELVPESLVLVQGKPFVDWQLDRFVASGARSLVMCVGSEGEQIEAHVRRALDRGLTVGYSYAGEQPLGTGGALRRAFARLEDEFVLTYGGRYVPFDYSSPLEDLRAHPEAVATLSVCPGPGSVTLEGDWVSQYGGPESAGVADCGVIALRRSALAGIEDGAIWPVEALLRKLARGRQLRAFWAQVAGYDVGGPELERCLRGSPDLL
jgi:N-acetyl-alpha-D-muramate 1-phosphate uridylyltransferase